MTLIAELSFGCEDTHPPVVRTPTAEYIFETSENLPVAIATVDPRGVGNLQILREFDAVWIETDQETWAWDYREWQWWRAHPHGESCRPRFYGDAELRVDYIEDGIAWIDYEVDGFWNRQFFIFPQEVEADNVHYDVVIEVGNESGEDVEEYGQFFASYTKVNEDSEGNRLPHWYWDASGSLVRWNEKGVDHLDGFIANPDAYFFEEGNVPHLPRGDGKIVGSWKKPVLVSNPTPGGWRSIILLDPSTTATLAQGMGGPAMDYVIFPGPDQKAFPDGDSFVARIRHHILHSPELPTPETLEALYENFESEWESLDSMLMTFVD